jgi:hypothetical protein
MKKIKKYFKIIGLALFIYIIYKIDLSQLFGALKNVNFIYLFLAFFLWLSTIIVKTIRWKVLTDTFFCNLKFKNLLLIFSKGLFLGIITPAKIGEFYLIKYLSDNSGISIGKSTWSVVLERAISFLFDIVASCVAFIILAFYMDMGVSFIAVSFLLAIIIFYLIFSKDRVKEILNFFLKIFIPKSFISKTSSPVDDFFEEMKKIKISLVLKLLGYDFIVFLIMVFGHFFLSLSINLSIPLWYFFLIVPVVSIITMIPVSVQGIGSREVSFMYFFTRFEIFPAQAVAFSLLVLFVSTLTGVPGLIVYLLNKNKK